MTYYPDLTRFEYPFQEMISKGKYPKTAIPFVNIGWLGAGHNYPRGETEIVFRERLAFFCRTHAEWVYWAGFHTCEFCGKARGSCEIRVVGKEKLYVAPVLVHHYVVVHEYRPPEEFIQAVLECPSPGSPGFARRLKRAFRRRWLL